MAAAAAANSPKDQRLRKDWADLVTRAAHAIGRSDRNVRFRYISSASVSVQIKALGGSQQVRLLLDQVDNRAQVRIAVEAALRKLGSGQVGPEAALRAVGDHFGTQTVGSARPRKKPITTTKGTSSGGGSSSSERPSQGSQTRSGVRCLGSGGNEPLLVVRTKGSGVDRLVEDLHPEIQQISSWYSMDKVCLGCRTNPECKDNHTQQAHSLIFLLKSIQSIQAYHFLLKSI